MKNVDDIYPVSPMQEVMLLHSLTHAGDDTLFNQFCYRIDAELNADAFERAWQQVLAHHPALRTGFVWEKVRRPLQVVRRSLEMPVATLDWRHQSAERQAQDFDAWREEDRRTGFDLLRPPLMRLTLIRLDTASWYFIWSSHHLVLDRWCMETLLADFDRCYAAQVAGEPVALGTAPSFRDYIKWVGDQDTSHATDHWRVALAGLGHGCLVTRGGEATGPRSADRLVDAETLDALRREARGAGVTAGILVQAAWALTLNRLSGRQDIVFGATVSGRPHEIPGVEHIVGSFVNNVPVRARLPATDSVAELLRTMQAAQQRRAPFEYLSPVDVHRCSDLPHGEPMFDSIMVWLAPGRDEAERPLPMQPLFNDYGTAFPLTLSVAERSDGLALDALLTRAAEFGPEQLLDGLCATLAVLAREGTAGSLGAVDGFRAERGFADAATTPSARGPAVPTHDDGAEAPDRRETVPVALMRDFLRAEWAQALGHDRFGDDDDFFALGGDSIRAAQLHTRIEAGTRRRIPLLTLLRGATVRRMADTLARGDWPARPGIAVAVREHGHGRPLFCVASPEVNTVGYSMLTRHLDPGRRVYVLQVPPDAEGPVRARPDELPRLATRYVDAMRDVQPDGPYDLLGMCGGAHLAAEMTRALEAHGDRAAFLGIVNTWGFYTISRLYYLNRGWNIGRYLLRRVGDVLGGATQRKPATRAPSARKPAAAPANGNASAAAAPVVIEDEVGLDSPWIRDVGFAHRDPRRPKIASAVTVFRIRPQQYWRIRDPGLGWSKQSADVHIVRLPGTDHDDILREPYVQHIAREIENCLRDAPPGHDALPQHEPITQTGNAL